MGLGSWKRGEESGRVGEEGIRWEGECVTVIWEGERDEEEGNGGLSAVCRSTQDCLMAFIISHF